MAEYIEREALKRDLIDNRSFYPAIVKVAIEKAPTADVVEVVRCKDCQYRKEWVKNGVGEYFCRRSGLWNLTEKCFCHCGAKMDGKGEGE